MRLHEAFMDAFMQYVESNPKPAAALYVYNLIDAIIAPGARRVVVQKGTGGNTYAFTPSILDGYAPGMTVAMTF